MLQKSLTQLIIEAKVTNPADRDELDDSEVNSCVLDFVREHRGAFATLAQVLVQAAQLFNEGSIEVQSGLRERVISDPQFNDLLRELPALQKTLLETQLTEFSVLGLERLSKQMYDLLRFVI